LNAASVKDGASFALECSGVNRKNELNAVVEGLGKYERVGLTRRRGVAEFRHLKREDQIERGDSGG